MNVGIFRLKNTAPFVAQIRVIAKSLDTPEIKELENLRDILMGQTHDVGIVDLGAPEGWEVTLKVWISGGIPDTRTAMQSYICCQKWEGSTASYVISGSSANHELGLINVHRT